MLYSPVRCWLPAPIPTGDRNIGVGIGAGSQHLTGEYNIYLGSQGGVNESNTIRIGLQSTRAFIEGIRGVTTGVANAVNVVIDEEGQLGTASSSRAVKEDILDMDEYSARLMKLRPVVFHYKRHKAAGDLQPQFGLIAEEVAEQMPELVARARSGAPETVYYQFLPPMLLNEYQKQQRTIDELRAGLAELRREVSLIRNGPQE